jgi:hypothetical protein
MDFEAGTSDGRTALQIAVQRSYEQMILELLKYRKNIPKSLPTQRELAAVWNAVARANAKIYEILIFSGIDKAILLESGGNLLHRGVAEANYRFLSQAFTKKRLPIDARCTSKRRTAIQWALRMCKGAIKKDGDQNAVSLTA